MTTPTEIRFGTDGWRGRIADDFTFANVRRVAGAIAGYVLRNEDPRRGIVVGFDCRFLGEEFARSAADEIAKHGIRVWLGKAFATTPAVSYAVRRHGAAGGVVITASHNPAEWNGVKFKAAYGGSAHPQMVRKIEAELTASALPVSSPAIVTPEDLVEPYLARLEEVVDLDRIAQSGFSIVVDPMYGAARGSLRHLLERHGIRVTEIHGESNPSFSGLNPEPIMPGLSALRDRVVSDGADVGFATDGDADRIGAIDRDGTFIDSHSIFAILLCYLVEVRGMTGDVAKTFSTTKLIDKIASRYGLRVHETPIGFKHISDLILSNDILIGGEESGGIGIPTLGGPERDGVLNALLLAEVMAHYGQSLGERVQGLHDEYGPHHTGRIDLDLAPGQKEKALEAITAATTHFAGERVTRAEGLDGIKLYLKNETWVMVRPSGTEPLLRLYAEGATRDAVNQVLSRTSAFVKAL